MVLIGLVLSTPILSKAVNNMDNRELNIVFLIGLVWSAFSTYGSSCWGLEFRFGGWLFVDCTFYYFLGFFCRRIVNCINKNKFYLLGIIGFIFYTFIYGGGGRKAPAFILYSVGLFVFISQFDSISENSNLGKVINFIAKHSYSVYLFHAAVTLELLPLFQKTAALTGRLSIAFVEAFFLITVVTLFLAWLIDTVIFIPIQNRLKKRWFS